MAGRHWTYQCGSCAAHFKPDGAWCPTCGLSSASSRRTCVDCFDLRVPVGTQCPVCGSTDVQRTRR